MEQRGKAGKTGQQKKHGGYAGHVICKAKESNRVQE